MFPSDNSRPLKEVSTNMKLPENNNRTGITTVGLSGCIILAGVVFGSLNPWWLTASALLIVMGTGLESGKTKD